MRLIDVDALTAEIQGMSIAVSAKDCVLARIATQTIIDAVPVLHAHWTDEGSLSCRCSHCGCKANDEFPYCPHCYARMDEKENSHG